MIKNNSIIAPIALAIAMLSQPAMAETQIGAISYWSDFSMYDKLPDNSLAVINPNNGIFVTENGIDVVAPNIDEYRNLVDRLSARGIKVLGYVPTGYFNHECDENGKCQTLGRIQAQIFQYSQNIPNLAGIFFDEVSVASEDPICEKHLQEYQALRSAASTYGFAPENDKTIAYNVGWWSQCAVTAANSGETLILFENSGDSYSQYATDVANATASAQAKGVKTWHLTHSVADAAQMKDIVATAKSLDVDYVYATDLTANAGVNTWGSLPAYWDEEVKAVVGNDEGGGGGDDGNDEAAGVNWGLFTARLKNDRTHMCLRGSAGHVEQYTCEKTLPWLMVPVKLPKGNYYHLTYNLQCATHRPSEYWVEHKPCLLLKSTQLWSMIDAGQGWVYFKNKSSGMTLSFYSNKTGAWGETNFYGPTDGQHFSLEKITWFGKNPN